jgi:hypothetical protein
MCHCVEIIPLNAIILEDVSTFRLGVKMIRIYFAGLIIAQLRDIKNLDGFR